MQFLDSGRYVANVVDGEVNFYGRKQRPGYAVARLVQKASMTSETPDPTQTPSRQANPSGRGFLKGVRTRVSSLGHGASSVAKPCSVPEPSLSECPPRLSPHRRAHNRCRCSNKTSPPRSFRLSGRNDSGRQKHAWRPPCAPPPRPRQLYGETCRCSLWKPDRHGPSTP